MLLGRVSGIFLFILRGLFLFGGSRRFFSRRYVLGLSIRLGRRSRRRSILDPFRWNVAEGKRVWITERARLRMARFPQADDQSRRRRKIHPIIESIDNIQIEFSEIQPGSEVSFAWVHQHSASLPVHQKEVKVIGTQEELGGANRGEASALGRARPAGLAGS